MTIVVNFPFKYSVYFVCYYSDDVLYIWNLMDIIIVTHFHHGGKFVEGTSTYIGKSEEEYRSGYVTVCGFYFKYLTTNNFVLVDNDFSLLNLTKNLGDGDFLDLYVQHVVDEVDVVKNGVPIVGVDKGLQQGAAQSENIDIEVGVDDASNLEGVETDWDISDDSQEFAIPDDDSEIDEELRTLRNERRTKLQRKKPVPTEEIILRVAGVDRGFEDIGRNKGLVVATMKLLPDCEQRMCARHLVQLEKEQNNYGDVQNQVLR
ncbi:hypothetical protein H5410_050184 [Solanum commersonii]|uniref:Uncharacterized protein n=1 Tax=Solanum commersonii TaxID=4109 RepID=A0A9J5WWB4_SOLCO|nr:hypothetical protein H5410_050184 [Solanum commersonii]